MMLKTKHFVHYAVALMSLGGALQAATYQWTGRGDGQVFTEANWTDGTSGGNAPSNSINPNAAISHTLLVNGLTPGGTTGTNGLLLLSSTGVLEVNAGTFRLSGTNNISGGTLRLKGGLVSVNALAGTHTSQLSDGQLELRALVPWPNTVTVDFTADSRAVLRLAGTAPATVRSTYLSRIRVNGAAAVEDTNVLIMSDGATGTVVTRYDANDTDADGLPDAWEQTHFGNLSQDGNGDGDNDGVANRFEYAAGTSPVLEDTDSDGMLDFFGLPGTLRREVWTNLNGNNIADLTSAVAFRSLPQQIGLVGSAEAAQDAGENYGERLRGWVKAPVTGTYKFWIAGDEAAELWLSTNGSRFTRQLIASVATPTAPREWTRYPSQVSAVITLQANQEYYLEVLRKEGAGVDSVAVAWEYTETATSTLTPRAVIPGSALRSWAPDAEDVDDDYLPDAWETAQGLNPVSALDGGYVDTDGDGMSNFTEYLNGGPALAWGGNPGLSEWSLWNLTSPTNVITALTRNETFAKAPNASGWMTGAESPQNYGSNFGRRVRGVITAPQTGTYYFYVSGDDATELWLNQNGVSRFGKARVAATSGYTAYRNFTAKASQKSAAVALTAGQQIYFETLHVEVSGSDHCSVGWLRPGQTVPEVIPSSAISTPVQEVWQNPQTLAWYNDDADNDSLPDHWEAQFGLAVTNTGAGAFASGEYGDYDGDGYTNFEEYAMGTNPTVINVFPGKIRREVWNGLSGSTLTSLKGNNGVLRAPDSWSDISGIEPAQNVAEGFGERLRGYIIPNVTGEYTFWVAGNDQCELWLSTNDKKFYKRLIAWLPATTATASYYTDFREWDKYYEQMSWPVQLQAGQKYFIEVLHKENTGSDHVSVAWRAPGGAREVLPTGVLESYGGEADDADGDYLPDSWETAKGLSPTDNGRVNAGNGEYGDPDGDGLTNREEFLLGTNPLSADTDGDGFTDRDEARVYGSNPVVSDLSPFQNVQTIQGGQAVIVQGSWRRDATTGYLYNDSVRGSLDFTVNAPQSGFYSIEIDLGLQAGSTGGAYPFRVLLDGVPAGALSPSLVAGQSQKVSLLLPYLVQGNHTIRLQLDNVNFARTLIIRSLALLKASGTDADNDGLPDWAMAAAHARNNLTVGSGTSLTSPAFVEGLGQAEWVTNSESATIHPAPDSGWYANIPLAEDGSGKLVTFDFERGVVQSGRIFSWAATNLATADPLKIRVGDKLRLTAFAGEAPTATAVALYVNGTLVAETTEDAPVVRQFNTAGVSQVRAVYTANGQSAERIVPVEVVGATFAGNPVALVNQWRAWSNPQIAPQLQVDFDTKVMLLPPVTEGSGTKFQYMLKDLQTRYAAARLAPGGPILASVALRAEELHSADQTMIREVQAYPDGSRLVEMKVAVNNLQSDTQVKIDIFAAGVVFQDTGTTTKTLNASDFGPNGLATVYFIQSGSTQTSVCHRINIYQGSVKLGGVNR